MLPIIRMRQNKYLKKNELFINKKSQALKAVSMQLRQNEDEE